MKNIKRLSTSALAITTASTLILGLAACSDNSNRAIGTDENGVDSNGVVRVDNTDSGIDVGPVTDPLKPGQKILATFNEHNRNYNEDYDVVVSVKLDNVKKKDNDVCFDLISRTEKAEGGNLDKKYDIDPWDEGPYTWDFDSRLLSFSTAALEINGGKKQMLHQDDSMRINAINGGRISERMTYDATVPEAVEIDNPDAPFGREYFVQVCANNKHDKPINVSIGRIFGYPDVADIEKSNIKPKATQNFDRLDHQDSTGWVIDPADI